MNPRDDSEYALDELPVRAETAAKLRVAMLRGTSTRPGAAPFESLRLSFGPDGTRRRMEKLNARGDVTWERDYDPSGRPTVETFHAPDGRITGRLELVHGSADGWREKRWLEPNGTIVYTVVAQRDPSGRLASGVYRHPNGEVFRVDTYSYDDQGHLQMLDMGAIGRWKLTYDAAGNLRSKTGDLVSMSIAGEQHEYDYDTRGLLVEMRHLGVASTSVHATFFGAP